MPNVNHDLDDSVDGLVPSQWGERSTSLFFDVPERRLLVAVLVDAVRVLCGTNRRERAAVLSWVRGEAARIPFLDLCYNLNLDPNRTARRLLGSAVKRQDAQSSRISSVRRTAVRHTRGNAAGAERHLLSA